MGELCVGIAVWGAVHGGAVCGDSCLGSCAWGVLRGWEGHAHQSPIPPVVPSTRGFPTTISPTVPTPAPVPAHSSSQVVHCRVCPPHPLHALVLVLHLAVYPASPTQGRVGSQTG